MNKHKILMIVLMTTIVCVMSVGIGTAEDVNLTLEGHFGGLTYATAVSGNYAYVGQGPDLVVLDISNPSQPLELGRIDTSDTICDIIISGSYAYVADKDKCLVIIDISDPAAPTRAGSYNTAGDVYGVAVSGRYAYVTDGRNGLVIVDISKPAAPTLAGSYDTVGNAYGVAVSGSYAYVADRTNGLVILRTNASGTDLIPPVLTIISPTNGASIANDTITVTGTASDLSGIASVTVNDALANGAADWSTWSAEVTLTEGANIITAVATDNAGNQNTTTITVYLVNSFAESLSIGSANAPSNSIVTIPVNVANVTNISGISFNLFYNSSVVTVSSVSANENFVGSSITQNIDNVNGTTRVALTNLNLISALAETPVIDIAFNITGGSGSPTTLDLQNVEFSDANSNPYTPAVVVDGIITVGIKGDFNGNGRVDIGDVAKVAFMVARKVPEDVNADFNENGRVDIGDAAKIAFYLAGKVSEL